MLSTRTRFLLATGTVTFSRQRTLSTLSVWVQDVTTVAVPNATNVDIIWLDKLVLAGID